MKKYIVGINWEQNSSAALFCNGECLGALSNERITRKKNDEAYPREAIDWLLNEFDVKKSEIKAVVFVSEQWAPGWILARHYTSFSTSDYLKEQNEIWWPNLYENKNVSALDVFSDKLDLEQFPGRNFWQKVLTDHEGSSAHPSENEILEKGKSIRKDVVNQHIGNADVCFMDHSSCHNAYAYFSQPNRSEKFLSVSLDAFGDGVNYSAKVYEPSGDSIEVTDVTKGGDFIIGRLYRYITLILGLKPNEHEYKVMGLSPYCKPKYFEHLFTWFKSIQDVDGLHFKYINRPKDHFFAIREKLFSERFDSIAGGVQAYTEYLVTSWIENLVKHTKVSNVCYAGGVAMNVKANMSISKLDCVDLLHVPPTPDDTSQAIGACYHYLHKNTSLEIKPFVTPYLGRQCNANNNKALGSAEILKDILESKDDIAKYDFITDNYLTEAAMLLSQDAVLGVIWGREEFGARALGNRSIVANPKKPDIKKKINEKIKDRDFWMPFAASIPEQYASSYLILDNEASSYAYMTNTVFSTDVGRENIAAGLHPYDDTCRPHIIPTGSNSLYEELIEEFGKISGVFALLNTSLNLHGLPICSVFEDAVHVLLNGDLDGLISDGVLVIKK